MTETEKCPFIGVDCEYILLARKAEIAQIESDLDNCDGPALQKAKIEIDRLDEDNRRLRFERDEARKEAERLRTVAVKRGLWKEAPCCLCGYNGPNYFQPSVHKCAEIEENE